MNSATGCDDHRHDDELGGELPVPGRHAAPAVHPGAGPGGRGRRARVRVLGSRHSFTDLADSDELVSLESLPADVAVDRDARTVSFSAGLRYGELAEALEREGLALANLASLPHISVAGAVATATHGSGTPRATSPPPSPAWSWSPPPASSAPSPGRPRVRRPGRRARRPRCVTRVTLDVEPAYQVRQRVFEALAWDALYEHFDEITAAGDSVSVFTRWGEAVDQVWVKRRVTGDPERSSTSCSARPRPPSTGTRSSSSTRSTAPPSWACPARGGTGCPTSAWASCPAAGRAQSEYLIPRRHAVAAIQSVHALAGLVRPLLQVSEVRTVAADRLWMSPQYGQDTIAIHFTWHPDPVGVQRALVELEAALAPSEGTTPLGKVFVADAAAIGPLYERLPDFRRLVDRLDPRGVPQPLADQPRPRSPLIRTGPARRGPPTDDRGRPGPRRAVRPRVGPGRRETSSAHPSSRCRCGPAAVVTMRGLPTTTSPPVPSMAMRVPSGTVRPPARTAAPATSTVIGDPHDGRFAHRPRDHGGVAGRPATGGDDAGGGGQAVQVEREVAGRTRMTGPSAAIRAALSAVVATLPTATPGQAPSPGRARRPRRPWRCGGCGRAGAAGATP